jgi:aldose 1-epimerase
MTIERIPYGTTKNGDKVDAFFISNGEVTFQALTYGAVLSSVTSLDREGTPAELTLGFDDLSGWESDHPYFGGTIGRFANRISKGRFKLEGKEYTLYTNDGTNHLHGGKEGFERRMWDGFPFQNEQEAGVKFSRTSPDGEEGYPGNLDVVVTYALSVNNELSIHYEAATDAPTLANLTNHAYWNLDGSGGRTSILDHELLIHSDSYVEVDKYAIPTGRILQVQQSPFDFRRRKTIGTDIQSAGGYDHCYKLTSADTDEPALAAEVYSPLSGRVMKIYTTQPGLQFYTGEFLDGTISLRGGVPAKKRCALCLEAAGLPDSPNQPDFPSAVLRPGMRYIHKTIHHFSLA